MLDIIEFISGTVSVTCFLAWIFMLIMEMTEAAGEGDSMTEPTRSWKFTKIGPILFFCWMATMCVYFVVQGLPR